jgi:hypothetical protein
MMYKRETWTTNKVQKRTRAKQWCTKANMDHKLGTKASLDQQMRYKSKPKLTNEVQKQTWTGK